MGSGRGRKRAWCAAAIGAVALTGGMAEPARGAEGWVWPLRGPLLTRYLNDHARPYAGGMHRGIDIGAAAGERVVAARSGRVSFAGALGSSGLVVAIVTADGRYATSYLHLGAIAVARGEQVAAGEAVGEVGTTGRRSVAEPHLHFGVRVARSDHDYVDPLSLLPALPAPAQGPPPPVSAPAPARASPAPVPVTAPARARAQGRVPAVRALPDRRGLPALRGTPAARALPAAARPAVRDGAPARALGPAPARGRGRPVPAGPAAGAERSRSPHQLPARPRERPRLAPADGGRGLLLIPAGIALVGLALAGRRVRSLALGAALRVASVAAALAQALRLCLRAQRGQQRAQQRAPADAARAAVLGPAVEMQ